MKITMDCVASNRFDVELGGCASEKEMFTSPQSMLRRAAAEHRAAEN